MCIYIYMLMMEIIVWVFLLYAAISISEALYLLPLPLARSQRETTSLSGNDVSGIPFARVRLVFCLSHTQIHTHKHTHRHCKVSYDLSCHSPHAVFSSVWLCACVWVFIVSTLMLLRLRYFLCVHNRICFNSCYQSFAKYQQRTHICLAD